MIFRIFCSKKGLYLNEEMHVWVERIYGLP